MVKISGGRKCQRPRSLTWAFAGSPDGIRTRATALRGRRARPLHNGAVAAGVTTAEGTVVDVDGHTRLEAAAAQVVASQC